MDRPIGGSGVGARVRAGIGTGAGFRVRGGIVFGFVGGGSVDAGDEAIPGMAAARQIVFAFEGWKALEEKLADVGHRGGRAKWNTVPCDGTEESAEGCVDVVVGIEPAAPAGETCGNLFGFKELQLLAGVEGAKGSVGRTAEHAAAASVGVGIETAV